MDSRFSLGPSCWHAPDVVPLEAHSFNFVKTVTSLKLGKCLLEYLCECVSLRSTDTLIESSQSITYA